MPTEVVALRQQRRPAGVVPQEVVVLATELVHRPRPRGRGALGLLAAGTKRLGHEAPTELAEPTEPGRLPRTLRPPHPSTCAHSSDQS